MHRHDGSCGCARRGGFAGNLRVIRTLIAGLQPIPTGVIGALDDAYSHGLAGRSGAIIAGEPSDPMYRFSGYLAYDRTALIPPGASTTLRHDPDTALPGTSGAVRTVPGGTVQDHLAQLTPGGWRR